jgi:pyroglutamyl-peptidase
LLLTGFEPFDGDALNPSWEVARALDGESIAGVRIVAQQLPCVFATAIGALEQALQRHRPRHVLALGLAGSRSAVSVERVAINLVDARIADNAGAQPIDEPVLHAAPAAYFSTLPVKAIVAALAGAGLPAELSFSAGSFVCNQVFFGLMHHLARHPQVRGGFIHLPPLPAQAVRHPGAQTLALADQVRALWLAIEVVLGAGPDRRDVGGTLS